MSTLQKNTSCNVQFPLSQGQKAFWFSHQSAPDSASLNKFSAHEIRSNVESARWSLAWQKVIQHHAVLRTTYEVNGAGDPVQTVQANVDVPQTIVAAEGWSEERLAHEMEQRINVPFDLEKGPILRMTLFERGASEWVQLVVIHHIACDATTFELLIDDFTRFYACLAVEPVPDYLDFLERDFEMGKLHEDEEDPLCWWQQTNHEPLPILELPWDRPVSNSVALRGREHRIEVSDSLVAELQSLAPHEQGLHHVLLAAFYVLLHRYTNQNDVIVGIPVDLRQEQSRYSATAGYFGEVLPFRIDVSGDPSFKFLLQQLIQVERDSATQRGANGLLAKLAESSSLDSQRASLSPAQFIWSEVSQRESEIRQGSLCLRTRNLEQHWGVPSGITLKMEYGANGLLACWCHNAELFNADTIARMAGQYIQLLECLTEGLDSPVSELSLLSSEERHRLLYSWNETTAPYPEDLCIHQIFERQVAITPDAIALVFKGKELTYRDLNGRANQLAHYLQRLGVKPDSLVGICVERSEDMIVALLGVLKSGAAYVPIDPSYPRDRIEYILEESEAELLVTSSQLPAVVDENRVAAVYLDTHWAQISEETPGNPLSDVSPSNMCYVIFTSGSTGKPKGVQIRHRSLVNFIHSMGHRPGLNESDRLVAVTTISFDIHTLEIYLPLTVGATVILASQQLVADGLGLAELIMRYGATVMQATPATWRMLLATKWPGNRNLKAICGGEALPRELANSLLEKTASLWNIYGPTETTVWSTLCHITPERTIQSWDATETIGRPIANTQVYILDKHLQPVPVGVAGELYIGGDGVAVGYLNRPDLTQKAFLKNPFLDHSRMYRTGDLARYQSDGNIEYLGRIDNQVKIRGFRIELGEIESVLASHSDIDQSVVMARTDHEDDTRLVAYVVPSASQGHDQTSDDSSSHLLEDGNILQEWQLAWDSAYEQPTNELDSTLNISGWKSSYTNELIPTEEMREWVECTVMRIQSVQPKSVLEIGCGTGMLLFRIAPECAHYCGVDVSSSGLKYIQQQIDALPGEWSHVRLLNQLAHESHGIESGAFDTVIINSVIQYFPSVDYLVAVIERAVNAVSSGGVVFVGDIRSFPLLEAFHASIQLFQASDELSFDKLRQQVVKHQQLEEELLIDPAFFSVLKQRLPAISQVKIELRRGEHLNEMNKFRYDAWLYVGDCSQASEPEKWDWQFQQSSISGVEAYLRESSPSELCVKGVPNSRLMRDVRLVELLKSNNQVKTVKELRDLLQQLPEGIDPESWWTLDVPYRISLTHSSGCLDRYDVFFQSNTKPHESPISTLTTPDDHLRPLQYYANNPSFGQLANQLKPKLREHCNSKLPDYMVPSAFIVLPELPLTPNGKVDRQALPAPDKLNAVSQAEYVAPRNEVEKHLIQIWEEVLSVSPIGIYDDFIQLGGHSLLGIKILVLVQERMNVELAVHRLFECPTVAELASLVRAAEGVAIENNIQPLSEGDFRPLSVGQEQMWFLNQLEPEAATYNEDVTLVFKEALNIAALQRSFTELIRRHEILRTTFPTQGGKPYQQIHEAQEFKLNVVDLRSLPPQDRDEQAKLIASEQLCVPFDLCKKPLLRATVAQLGEADFRLNVTMHHILFDGESGNSVLFPELKAIYTAFAKGLASPLPPLSLQYSDFSAWQRQWLQGEFVSNQLAYWEKHLAGVQQMKLATDYPRSSTTSSAGSWIEIDVPSCLTNKLKALSRDEGVTLYMTLVASLQVLLYRHSGQDDVVIGTLSSQHNRAELQGMIGYFLNTLALRSDLSGNPTFRAVLQRVRKVILEAYANQDVPFQKVVNLFSSERNVGENPLFQVGFAFQPPVVESTDDWNIQQFMLDNGSSKFDVSFLVEERQGQGGDDSRIVGKVEYKTDLFAADSIKRLLNHWLTVLSGIVTNPDQNIALLPLLMEEERHQLLLEWNDTHIEYSNEGICLHQLFEEQVERIPNEIAVVCGDETLTYRELNQRANQLARYLRKNGVNPETLVGISLDRSTEMVIALHAVVKAGGAYIPIDPTYPQDRIAYMLEDSNAPLLLTKSDRRPSVTDYAGKLVCLDSDWELIAAEDTRNLSSVTTPDSLMYVIYTSGSTGKPKGSMVYHRSVLNVVNWFTRYIDITPLDRVLILSSFSFDITNKNFFAPLLVGGQIHLLPAVHYDPLLARTLIEQHRITWVNCTPGVFYPLTEPKSERTYQMLSSLRFAILGGESISLSQLWHWLDSPQCNAKIINNYGPTECTDLSTTFLLENPAEYLDKPIPLGQGISNVQHYILDQYLQPVPVNVPGTLYISGAGVGAGYLNRPDLTAERFVPNPFQSESRMYNTGDLARYLADGTIEYLGRMDSQVKIRGFRIELGEIESALDSHPDVGQSVVMAREDTTGGTQLVAYATPNLESTASDVDGLVTVDQGDVIVEDKINKSLQQWEYVFNNTYDQSNQAEATLDLTGWNSSYTGEPIAEDEMREWVDNTLARIKKYQSNRQQRILEIGFGTGMLLFNLAAEAEYYCGTELSQQVLHDVRLQVDRMPDDWGQVELRLQQAHDFSGLGPDSFDSVIINSVCQYFPDIDYLLGVLEQAVRTVSDGGMVFVGDIRSLPLLEMFHSSIQFSQAPDDLTLADLQKRIAKKVQLDKELVIDPDFFSALPSHIPRISHVTIQMRRGESRNEMTKFRYDAVLHIGRESMSYDTHTLHWQAGETSVDLVRDKLLREQDGAVLVKYVPDARLCYDIQLVELLQNHSENLTTVGGLRNELTNQIVSGVEPERWWELDLPYEIEVTASSARKGTYDVLFRPINSKPTAVLASPSESAGVQAWSSYANNPLFAQAAADLPERLHGFLRDKLPDYMVPSAYIILDEFPLAPSGKVNRHILPEPESGRSRISNKYVKPKNETEFIVTEIWQQVLQMGGVGVHDNFFDLGGHSLLIVQVSNQLSEALNDTVTVLELFQYPTIHSFSEYFANRDSAENVTQKAKFEESEKLVSKRKRTKDMRASQRQRRRAKTTTDSAYE